MKYVLLPGLDGTGELLLDFVAALQAQGIAAANIILVRYDDEVTDYDRAITSAQSYLPDEAFILIAESFSGPVAIKIAATKPDLLKGLVFVATFAKAPRKIPSTLASVIRVMPTRNRWALALAMPLLVGKWSRNATQLRFEDVMKHANNNVLAKRLSAVSNINVVDCLADIEAPSLYLQAGSDRLVPDGAADPFKNRIKSVTFRTIEGPHFLLQTQAEECAKIIVDFTERES